MEHKHSKDTITIRIGSFVAASANGPMAIGALLIIVIVLVAARSAGL